MTSNKSITIETIFAELLWQRAHDAGIDHKHLQEQNSEYKSLKSKIIDDLKKNTKIDFELGQELITIEITQDKVKEFLEIFKNEKEERRIIERAIFIANQEYIHNDDELNDDR